MEGHLTKLEPTQRLDFLRRPSQPVHTVIPYDAVPRLRLGVLAEAHVIGTGGHLENILAARQSTSHLNLRAGLFSGASVEVCLGIGRHARASFWMIHGQNLGHSRQVI